LNFVTSEEAPMSRSEERKLWLCAWHRLRRLLKLGLVFRANRQSVTMQKPVSTIRRTPVGRRHRRPTALRSVGKVRASTHRRFPASALNEGFKEGENELLKPRPLSFSANQPQCITESAPTPEEISAAAKELAARPRRPKRKWTGWIGGIHAYRNMRIVLPSGDEAFVAGVLRGRCVFTFDEGRLIGGFDGEPFRWGVVPAEEVQIVKNSAAQQLAAQKRGVKERPSEKKKAACRLNALVPPRPGSRARGRPRKPTVTAGAVQR
jgi:hypothetical protein